MLQRIKKFGLGKRRWERQQNVLTRWAYFWWEMRYFYIEHGGRRGGGVIIIKVFPWQFLFKIWPKIIVITLNIKLFCCKNHKSSHCRCSVKEHVFKETPTQVLSCETCEIPKNIYFQEHLWTSASTGHYGKKQLLFLSRNY